MQLLQVLPHFHHLLYQTMILYLLILKPDNLSDQKLRKLKKLKKSVDQPPNQDYQWRMNLMVWFTMLLVWESTNSCLCRKLTNLKTSWHMLRVLPELSFLGSYLPLVRALNEVLYDLLPTTYRGIKNMINQIWNI